MCPWVGPHAPSFGRQPWRLPSRVEYLSPQEVLLPLVYGTTASPLRLEHTTTPAPSNISPACSATQTAGRTSRSSRTDCKSPSTTQRCAQRTSQPTSKNDTSSS